MSCMTCYGKSLTAVWHCLDMGALLDIVAEVPGIADIVVEVSSMAIDSRC